jgi:hypothetical protein
MCLTPPPVLPAPAASPRYRRRPPPFGQRRSLLRPFVGGACLSASVRSLNRSICLGAYCNLSPSLSFGRSRWGLETPYPHPTAFLSNVGRVVVGGVAAFLAGGLGGWSSVVAVCGGMLALHTGVKAATFCPSSLLSCPGPPACCGAHLSTLTPLYTPSGHPPARAVLVVWRLTNKFPTDTVVSGLIMVRRPTKSPRKECKPNG